MPKTRQPKRTKSASSGRSEKCTKRVDKLPTGENKSGITLAICFCDTVKDEDDKVDVKYATIKVKINRNKPDGWTNLEDKEFIKITNLTYAGVEVVKVLRSLDLDLYRPQGITGSDQAFQRILYFKRVLSGSNTRSQFSNIYSLVTKQTLIKWGIKDDDPDRYEKLSSDRTLFSKWISPMKTYSRPLKSRVL
jgi:hypothetical protein